jgi:hypothetical protein
LCVQAVLLLRELTFTPVYTRDPALTRARATHNRQVLYDHLDILEGVLQQITKDGCPPHLPLNSAVQLVGPEAAELLLRYGARPSGALETNFLWLSAQQNRFCAAELKELLTRYGIQPRADAPPLYQPPVLYANLPPQPDAPGGPQPARTVAIVPDWPAKPGESAVALPDAIGSHLDAIKQVFRDALRQTDADTSPEPPSDDAGKSRSTPESE